MWNEYGNPPPIIDRSYGDPGFSKKRDRATAGTRNKCKYCGRMTYRFIGATPVCSYCTGKEPDKWPVLNRVP